MVKELRDDGDDKNKEEEEYEEEELEEQIFAYSEVEVETKELLDKEEKRNELGKQMDNNSKKFVHGNKRDKLAKDNCGNKEKDKCLILGTVEGLNKENKYQPISDLFDYYYEHESLTEEEYQIGDLDRSKKINCALY
ncbi:hypothetical protein F8M41_001842 [Gigaspora margarita]|uniref:Uncharacterized protein n=1 Tax=Gigaspora margarita TaxID=4874 RepID=A0A8H4ESL1_GIGMA|nr:hypothetical protein F8M41_001842 [Gigaspora margarita]